MKIDINIKEINNAEYMKKKIYNRGYVQYLGEELRKNPEFIMEMARDPEFESHWTLLRFVDESLINTKFIIEYLKALHNKGVLTSSNSERLVQVLHEILPEESIFGNEELWDAIEELGIINHEVIKKASYEASKIKIFDMLERIEEVTYEEFMKKTSVVWRDDFEFMLEVLTRNPSLYECLSKNLKENKEFEQLLISKNPESERIINEYKKRQQAEEEQKRQKEEEKRNQRKKERAEMKRQEEEHKQEELKKEYEEQGENHPNLILVKQFLDANTSKKLFCKKYNVDIKDLDKAIEEVSSVYPQIARKVAGKNKQISAIHLSTIESINSKLLSGEITLQQYSQEFYRGKKINELLRHITDKNQRKQFHTLVIKAIVSGELTMMDYVRLFSEEYDYKNVMNSINTYIKTANAETPELQGKGKPSDDAKRQIRTLKKYSKPYQSKDFIGSKRGFTNSDGEVEMTTITEEHLKYAKKYLHLEDEYICYSTVDSVLSKLIKGEITFEDIDQRITEKISMNTVVANAIQKGTTGDEVKDATQQLKNTVQENAPTINKE